MQTYCETGDVASFAEQQGYTTVWNQEYSEEDQKRFVTKATLAIEAYHRQPREYGAPWGMDMFRDAAVLQSLWYARTGEVDEMSARIAGITPGSFSDNILSVSSANTLPLDSIVQAMVDSIISDCGLVGRTSFARA